MAQHVVRPPQECNAAMTLFNQNVVVPAFYTGSPSLILAPKPRKQCEPN